MQTLQEKMLKLVADVIKKAKLDPVVSFDYSNTGTVHIQDPNSIESYGSIFFNFQSKTVTFRAKIDNTQLLSQPNRLDYHDWYIDNTDSKMITKFLLTLSKALKKVDIS